MFRQLIIARLCFPANKLKTTDFLSKHQFFFIDGQHIYLYPDEFYKTQKELVQQISYKHTLCTPGGELSIVFYDITKDGKHQNPQVVLGLLMSIEGYPVAYYIVEGYKFNCLSLSVKLDVFHMAATRLNLNQKGISGDPPYSSIGS